MQWDFINSQKKRNGKFWRKIEGTILCGSIMLDKLPQIQKDKYISSHMWILASGCYLHQSRSKYGQRPGNYQWAQEMGENSRRGG